MRRSYLLALLGLLLMAGCGDSAAPNSVIRFSVLPDWNKGKLAANSQKLAELLTEKLGVEVRYEPSNDYTACVNALVANKIDFVWLGGKTTCDAIDLGKGKVHVLATRDIDLKFKTYFIGNQAAIAAGKLAPVASLEEWQGKAKELRFTFGSNGSTSGHLMPRYFLSEAGISPEEDFASVGNQGSHSGTLQAVANGTADFGALNYAWYDQASAELKAKAPILFTTPEYVDYAWVAHDRIGADVIAKLKAAMLGLDRNSDRASAILDGWAAGSFQSAKDEQWDAIRQVRDSLEKDFLKK